MTNRTDPSTFPGAIARIIGIMGAGRAAVAVNRSEQTVYNWANPEGIHFPNLQQAIELDVAYMAAGHGKPPIFGVYGMMLDRAAEVARAPADVRVEMLDVLSAAGGLAESIKVTVAEESEGGRAISKNELLRILEKIADARRQLDDVEAAARLAVRKD